MRLLSVRLIVSLILGVTLVSAGFSYYEVLGEKRALRRDLDVVTRYSVKVLSATLSGHGTQARTHPPARLRTTNCNGSCSDLETGNTCWASSFTTGRASQLQ